MVARNPLPVIPTHEAFLMSCSREGMGNREN